MTAGVGDGEAARGPRCPICGKPAAADHKPFCSRRCADVDLNRWLKGGYSIPVAESDDLPDDGDGDDR